LLLVIVLIMFIIKVLFWLNFVWYHRVCPTCQLARRYTKKQNSSKPRFPGIRWDCQTLDKYTLARDTEVPKKA